MVQMLLERPFTREAKGKDAERGEVIRVIIVETHALMREALYRVITLFPQVQVCARLSTLEDIPALFQKTRAHVIVLSSSLPVSACLDCVEALRQSATSAGVVVIQGRLSPETTLTLMKQGVHSLLGEDASEEDLGRAIVAAAAQDTFLDRRAREILNSTFTRAAVHLTRREVEVLSLLKCGKSNFCIAGALGMKEKTVEKHLSRIYEKLNISSRTEAILQTQRLCI